MGVEHQCCVCGLCLVLSHRNSGVFQTVTDRYLSLFLTAKSGLCVLVERNLSISLLCRCCCVDKGLSASLV